MVCLYPQQELVVVLTDEYQTCHVTENSDCLALDRVEHLRNGVAYYYRQRGDYSHWTETSNVLLGEISVTAGFIFSSLCIVLQSTQGDIITAISPRKQSIKVEPQQSFHIVVPQDDYQDWDWTAHHRSGWMIECVSNYTMLSDKAIYRNGHEYHCLFRYERTSVENMKTLVTGVYPGGTLSVYKGGQEYELHLLLNIRGVNQPRRALHLHCRPRIPRNPYVTPINKYKMPGPYISSVRLREKENCTMESDCRVQYTSV